MSRPCSTLPSTSENSPMLMSVRPNPRGPRSVAIAGAFFVSISKTEMKPSSLPMLATDLASALAVPNPTGERVFIRADQDVKYRQFMDVINQLQTDGYFKIGLISEEVQPAAG